MLAGRLKVRGWLAIVTGSADAIPDCDLAAEFWYFRFAGHLQMLSDRHVDWLANRLNLRADVLHRCSHYDTRLWDRVRQSIQRFAYCGFRRRPRSGVAALLRVIPVVNRAERWTNAPALTYTADHVVAVLRKT
jgi:hypothetical protein